MKKVCNILISLLFVLTLTSCTTTSITVYKLKGSITAYNADGTILKEWNGITIQEKHNDSIVENIIKKNGINFYDPKSKKCIMVTNSVPCIIEYDVN